MPEPFFEIHDYVAIGIYFCGNTSLDHEFYRWASSNKIFSLEIPQSRVRLFSTADAKRVRKWLAEHGVKEKFD